MDESARQWHREHQLGSRASLDDRVDWHIEHARHCSCREMPASIRAEIEQRGLSHRLPPQPG